MKSSLCYDCMILHLAAEVLVGCIALYCAAVRTHVGF
jgi:hypothetical protein